MKVQDGRDMEAKSDGVNRLPRRPTALPEIAEAILSALAGRSVASNVVLGGGIALKHYVDFRATQDIDAWWREAPDEAALEAFVDILSGVAEARGLRLNRRRFGVTDSLEFLDAEGRKVFSFQIASRDVTLEPPLPSEWPPVQLESLTDNLGSKMNALVNRGAPRDFLDIHRIVTDGLATTEQCWEIWARKNGAESITSGVGKVEGHLDRLEQRRPIASVPPAYRGQAAELRSWFRQVFLQRPA